MSQEIIPVHQSSLNTIEMCGERYRRKEIDKDPDYAGTAALRGTGVHGAAQANHRQKRGSGKDLPKKELQDVAVAAFEEKMAVEGYRLTPEEETLGKGVAIARAKDDAVTATGTYSDRVAPLMKPELVEQKITVRAVEASPEGPAVDLVGTLDLSTLDGRIRDLKTTTRTKSKFDADHSLQFTMYGELYTAATGKAPTGFDLDQIVLLKKGPEYKTVPTTRGPRDRAVLVARINALLAARKHGVFQPAPVGSWWCSPKWCGYWNTCPFVNGERLAAADAAE